MSDTYKAPATLRVGHIHLKVADLTRAVRFYEVILGFDLLFNLGTFAFLSAGGYHHHIGLNTWESHGGAAPAEDMTGLYHFALNYPTEQDLARIVKRLIDAKYPLDGASDHTSHLAVYLRDPDENGIELAWDREPSFWADWIKDMTPARARELNKPLDLEALLAMAI